MADITTRSGKGSPLTNDEVDANFTNLNNDKAELSGANFTGSIDVTGTVTADGLTVDGDVAIASDLPSITLTDNNNSSSRADIEYNFGYLAIDADANNVDAAEAIDLQIGGTTHFRLATGGDISFYEDTGTTPKFFWDASAERLGIGTSSPLENLHISSSTGNVAVRLDRSGSSTDTTSIELANGGTGNPTTIIESGGTSSSSNGIIFKRGNSGSETERMRIDSSGNLLVGTTDTVIYNHTSGADQGIVLGSENGIGAYLQVARQDAATAFLNRMGTDGTIIDLRKDGTTVGSIGTKNGDITVGTGDTGLRFVDSSQAIWVVDATTGNARNGAVDLGSSAVGFKDLYLSGGVYLGGTGAANLLDDYEEGTFTPVLTGSTSGTFNGAGKYTKTGDVVHIFMHFTAITTANKPIGDYTITGLPFTSRATTPDAIVLNIGSFARVTFDSAKIPSADMAENSSTVALVECTSNSLSSAITDANFVNGSNMFFRISGSYPTN